MFSLAFISGPDTLLFVAVLILLFPAFFIKRGVGVPLRNLGRLVGSLMGSGTRTRHSPAPELEMSDTALEERSKKILGLSGRITPEDIKRRWRELSRQYHPDQVQHLGPKLRAVAEKEMKDINGAYQYLRKKYGV